MILPDIIIAIRLVVQKFVIHIGLGKLVRSTVKRIMIFQGIIHVSIQLVLKFAIQTGLELTVEPFAHRKMILQGIMPVIW